MHSRPLLFIIIETKVREFHGKSYLAWVAARNGFDVLMGGKKALWAQMDLDGRGIYVDKSVALTHIGWGARCRAMGHRLVSWDEEGLVFFDAEMYRKLRIGREALMQTERFFAWGQTQKDAICDAYPEAGDRIVLCGNPRFDLLRPDLRGIYAEAVRTLKARYGRLLLINTSFALYSHFRPDADLKSELKLNPLSKDPNYIDGWIDIQRRALEGFSEMLPALVQRFPDHKIVIRPHPSEKHQFWIDRAKKFPGMEVNGERNVHEWIMASDVVIHFNCTTAIEAYLLGVPAIAFRPVRSDVYENALPNALSINAFDTAQLMEQISLCMTDPRNPEVWLWTDERERLVRRYISGLDGVTSVERMVEELQKVAAGFERRRSLVERLIGLGKRMWRGVLRLQRSVRAKEPEDAYMRHKLPGLNKLEIEEALQQMAITTGKPMGCAVREVARDCFLITAASIGQGSNET